MNYADQAADLSSMAASATSEILNNTTNSISNNLTSVLTGATSFKDGMSNIFSSLGETVIKTLIQMATQALITKAIMASFGGGAGGMFGSLFGGASGAASSGTALQSFGSSFAFNALGGVYDSPSLSAYSGGVYSTPQYFAFAKGAGVFGEAGPEAIMPLTRGADGSLGVRAVGRESPAVQDAARQIEAQPRIAVSVDARSTFSGQPDDATMLAVDRRNAALERRIINTLTAEVNNPRRNSDAPSTPIYSPKNQDRLPGGLMADIIYPDEYLPMPLMDGYGFKPISPLLRTEMTSGRARQRRRYTSTPTQASVKWIFQTDALAQVFEAFFRTH
jgi:phage-related minor tail protein